LLGDYELRGLLQGEGADRVTGELAGLLAGNTGRIRVYSDLINALDQREAASPSSEGSSLGGD